MAPPGYDHDKEKLLRLILRDAYFREKIILSSGKESDYYIDARRVTLQAEGAYLSARLILAMVANDRIDAIGGPTLGADPLLGAIAVLSYQNNRPVDTFIIRKTPKPHGRQQQIEGPILKYTSRVILIDDVATTGKAFLESLDVLEKVGIKPLKAICIVDRHEGAGEALKARGCSLEAIFSIDDIHRRE